MSKLNVFLNSLRRYKYIFVIGVFVLLVGFIDENSFYNRYANRQQINALKQAIREQTEQYERDTEQLNSLTAAEGTAEKVARERYFMKAPEEDVFVVVKE